MEWSLLIVLVLLMMSCGFLGTSIIEPEKTSPTLDELTEAAG
ncbi:MAG: hypothetical protein ACE5FT_01915 [Candidatus Nanoarchaeia archaeon]